MEEAHLSLAEKISQGVCLDSLPYVDKEYEEPGMQELVDTMIQEEMKMFRPRNYLEEWPMPSVKFEDDPALQQEWERIRMKQPLQGFDVNRYTLEEPSGDAANDAASWKKSVEVARLQLEYQKEKLENLLLLEKFGSNAWRIHNDDVEGMIDRMDGELGSLQEKTEIINRKRKQTQEESSEKLFSTQWQALELQMKNYQIERSCEALEKKVKVDAVSFVC